MDLPPGSVLPKNSLVLVTGVTGFLAGVIADQLLRYGFRVRGTARDVLNEKAAWMPEFFESRYGPARFELSQVSDMTKQGCFDEAIKGCSGVVHVASVVAVEADPNEIITPSIAFLDNLLDATEREQSVKRFVLTSSSAAVAQEKLNEVYDLTPDVWADWAVKQAWSPPPYTPERTRANYYASKVQTEQRLWEYVKERKPRFAANSVLPDFILGLPVNPERQGFSSSMSLFKQMFESDGDFWRLFGAQWSVDVVDTALLHIAGLISSEVFNQRIFAYGHRKTWTDFIRRMQIMYPKHVFPEPSADEGEDLSNVIGRAMSEELLQWLGKPGFRDLDASLQEVGDELLSQKT